MSESIRPDCRSVSAQARASQPRSSWLKNSISLFLSGEYAPDDMRDPLVCVCEMVEVFFGFRQQALGP